VPDEVISILIADDHEVVRSGLKAIFRGQSDLDVVAEAADGQEAIREAARVRPRLVVMDVRMPGKGGIEACRDIRSAHPGTNVLMLTSFNDEHAVMCALVAGAGGFMLKDANKEELLKAVRTVGAGGKLLDEAGAAAVIEHLRNGQIVSPEDKLVNSLTERETAILDMIAEGLTNREIGERLFLAEKTVKHHVSDLLGKLGFSRRVEAATFATRRQASHPA
jgi:two-component system, NarL family, response regulator DevR